MVLHE
jgi:hypothetical protein